MEELSLNEKRRWALDILVGTFSPNVKLLRDALITEMAYNMYLEQNIPDNITPFNDLPVKTRRKYFEKVEKLLYNE
jgi:hypothetical protein